MAKLKLMCALVAELLMKCREEEEKPAVELNGNHFVLWQPTSDTIVVYVEDQEFGLIRYDIKFKEGLTVKEVFDNFIEADLVDIASVEGKSLKTGQTLCSGSLLHGFAIGDDPVHDRISTHYDMDIFRYMILREVAIVLNIKDK